MATLDPALAQEKMAEMVEGHFNGDRFFVAQDLWVTINLATKPATCDPGRNQRFVASWFFGCSPADTSRAETNGSSPAETNGSSPARTNGSSPARTSLGPSHPAGGHPPRPTSQLDVAGVFLEQPEASSYIPRYQGQVSYLSC